MSGAYARIRNIDKSVIQKLSLSSQSVSLKKFFRGFIFLAQDEDKWFFNRKIITVSRKAEISEITLIPGRVEFKYFILAAGRFP
jgi:hypothetical protein